MDTLIHLFMHSIVGQTHTEAEEKKKRQYYAYI